MRETLSVFLKKITSIIGALLLILNVGCASSVTMKRIERIDRMAKEKCDKGDFRACVTVTRSHDAEQSRRAIGVILLMLVGHSMSKATKP